MKKKFFLLELINKFNTFNKKSYSPLVDSSSNLLKNIKISKDSLISIFYMSGIFLYILSLWHINALDMRCFFIKEGVECYYTLAKLIFISSILTSISIYLIIIKKYRKYHIYIILISYSFLFYIDHSDGVIKHGFYNILAFITMNFIFLLIIIFLHFFYLQIKKRKFIIIIIAISIIFVFLISLKIYKLNNFSCENWTKGLNESFIDNISKDYPCFIKIPKPHSCYLPEMGKYFDMTSKYRPSCLAPSILKNEKKNFLKDLKNLKYFDISKKNHFGFPLTNTDDINPYEFGNICYFVNKSFVDYIYDKIIFMDLYYSNKNKYYPNISKPEVEILFEEEKGKFLINVQRNETLIKERRNILKDKNKVMYKNVLVFFFDTLSRAHFFRKFPKTIKFFNKFVKYEKNYKKKI